MINSNALHYGKCHTGRLTEHLLHFKSWHADAFTSCDLYSHKILSWIQNECYPMFNLCQDFTQAKAQITLNILWVPLLMSQICIFKFFIHDKIVKYHQITLWNGLYLMAFGFLWQLWLFSGGLMLFTMSNISCHQTININ